MDTADQLLIVRSIEYFKVFGNEACLCPLALSLTRDSLIHELARARYVLEFLRKGYAKTRISVVLDVS
jgi:hypothetical protein